MFIASAPEFRFELVKGSIERQLLWKKMSMDKYNTKPTVKS